VLAKVLRAVLGCSRMLLVATDAPKINRLQAIVVMAWKRSSVRSPDLFFLGRLRC